MSSPSLCYPPSIIILIQFIDKNIEQDWVNVDKNVDQDKGRDRFLRHTLRTHALLVSLIQQVIFIEYLMSARQPAFHWEYNSEEEMLMTIHSYDSSCRFTEINLFTFFVLGYSARL